MHLPSSLPDELLFSRIIRLLLTNGITKEQFFKDIYGNSQITIHPYLPLIVNKLIKLTDESKENLINKQTMMPLFITFLPQYKVFLNECIISKKSDFMFKLSKFIKTGNNEYTMKFCPSCVLDSINNFGIPYWQRSHQILGIESCHIHRKLLLHCILPKKAKTRIGLPQTNLKSRTSSDLSHSFAKYANKFINDEIVKNEFNSKYYLKLLNKLGYINTANHIRMRFLTKDFYEFTKKLNYHNSSILPASSTDYPYLKYLLNGKHIQTPFKHLLFNFWLLTKKENKINHIDIFDIKHIEVKDKCIALLKQKIPISKISSQLNKSRSYVLKIAIKHNLSPKNKYNDISNIQRKEILLLAYKGYKRKAISTTFKISNATLDLIILSTDGLREWRKKCTYESRRRRHKLKIIRYRQKNPYAMRTDFIKNCKGAYNWLFKYEIGWLNKNIPGPKPRILNFRN